MQKLTDEYVKEVGGVACGVRAGLVPPLAAGRASCWFSGAGSLVAGPPAAHVSAGWRLAGWLRSSSSSERC